MANDNAQLTQLTLSVLFVAGLYSLDLAGFTLPQPSSPPQQTNPNWVVNWSAEEAAVNTVPVVSTSEYAVQTRRNSRRNRVRISDKLPSVVADTAKKYSSCGVNPSVFLGIAWHERGMVHGWFDDYLFGYGAYDHGKWGEKYKGWQNQWSFASRKICGHFASVNSPDINTFQAFARDVYKTTDWQHYRNAYLHYLKFKENFQ